MLHSVFFNDTATTEIYTLSLHDALPICGSVSEGEFDLVFEPSLRRNDRVLRNPDVYISNTRPCQTADVGSQRALRSATAMVARSEEHTSELQSRQYLVCRLLLEKKKQYY